MKKVLHIEIGYESGNEKQLLDALSNFKVGIYDCITVYNDSIDKIEE